MSRQERTAKRVKAAATQAAEVIEVAYTKIRCKTCSAKGKRFTDGSKLIKHGKDCPKAKAANDQQYREFAADVKAAQKPSKATKAKRAPSATPATPQGGSVDLNAECKRLRDEAGMAWWRIAWELKLPGAADNVKQGKSGAAQARRLYAQANGGKPHVPSTRPAREKAARNPRHEANSGSKMDRKWKLLEQGHVIPTDLEDEAVLAMVAGRTIEWGVNVTALCSTKETPPPNECHWLNQEARVHPTDLYIEEEESQGSRVLRFREYLGIDSETGRHMAGPTRSVRVNRIHTVR